MKKLLIIFLALITGVVSVFAQDVSDRIKFDAEVEFKLDDSDIVGDKYYLEYELQGTFTAEYMMNEKLSTIISIEVDRNDVDPDEVSVLYTFDEMSWIKGGIFQRDLYLNDFVKKRFEIFEMDSPGVEYMKKLGYSSNDTGVRYVRDNFLAENLTLDATFFFNSAHNETQFLLTGMYNFEPDRHFLALTASYLPYVVHHASINASDEYQYNNFLLDAKYFMYSTSWVVTGEASIGTNLVDPVGLLHFPGKEESFFAAADAAVGYNISTSRFVYTPAFRAGILMPDIDRIEDSRRVELLLGNSFHGRNVFMHLEGGFQFDTYDNGGGLETDVEPIWSVSFCVKS